MHDTDPLKWYLQFQCMDVYIPHGAIWPTYHNLIVWMLGDFLLF